MSENQPLTKKKNLKAKLEHDYVKAMENSALTFNPSGEITWDGKVIEIKNWKTDEREDFQWTNVILFLFLFLQVMVQFVFLLFALAFVLGGTAWSPFNYTVSITVVGVLSFLAFCGIWVYVTYSKQNFFYLNYGKETLKDTTLERPPLKLEIVRVGRARAYNMFVACYTVALVVQLALLWGWITNNHKFEPKCVGCATPNTPDPHEKEYWYFYLIMGAIMLVGTIMVILIITLLMRLFDDNPTDDTILSYKPSTEVDNVAWPSAYSVLSMLIYLLLNGYCLTWLITFSATDDNINMTGLLVGGSVLMLLVFIQFIVVKLKVSHQTNINPEIRHKINAEMNFLIIFNVFQLIYYVYYYSDTTKAEFGDGHFPPFQPARAAVGQTNAFYFTRLVQMINISILPWAAAFGGQSLWFSIHQSEITKTVVQSFDNDKVHKGLYALKFVIILYGALTFAFMLNELIGTPYLAVHFRDWTAVTIAFWGLLWVMFVIFTSLTLHGLRSAAVHHVSSAPLISGMLSLTAFFVIYLWVFSYFQHAHNGLGKASANAHVKDLSDPISVNEPELMMIILLSLLPIVYFLADYLGHSTYYVYKALDRVQSTETGHKA